MRTALILKSGGKYGKRHTENQTSCVVGYSKKSKKTLDEQMFVCYTIIGFDIRSNHYAASKALSGVKMLPDFSVPLCGLGKDNYRRLP